MRLWDLIPEARPNLDFPAGALLLKLIERFGTRDPFAGFTAAARLYER